MVDPHAVLYYPAAIKLNDSCLSFYGLTDQIQNQIKTKQKPNQTKTKPKPKPKPNLNQNQTKTKPKHFFTSYMSLFICFDRLYTIINQ